MVAILPAWRLARMDIVSVWKQTKPISFKFVSVWLNYFGQAFSIGSLVPISPAVKSIFVRWQKCRANFFKKISKNI